MVCLSSIFWLVWPSSIIHQTCSTWNLFVHYVRTFVCTLIFTITWAIVWAIVCTIICTVFFIGPGFKPLGLHHNLFGRSRVWTPDLAVWSFCGSRVYSQTQSPGSGWTSWELSKVNLRSCKNSKSWDHALSSHKHETAQKHRTPPQHSQIITHKCKTAQKHGNTIRHNP